MIVTFLALLELIRLKRVKVYQRGLFGSIRVFRPVGPTEDARRRCVATREDRVGQKDDAKKKKAEGDGKRPSAMEAYVAGPPIAEPDGVGESRGRAGPRPAARASHEDEASVLPPQQIRAVIEALVFASPQPITPKEIARVLQGVAREDWQRELEEICRPTTPATSAGCSSSRWPAASRSRRAPSTTTGCAS